MFARGELWRGTNQKKHLRKHLLLAPDHLVELRGKHLAVRLQRRERHTVLGPAHNKNTLSNNFKKSKRMNLYKI